MYHYDQLCTLLYMLGHHFVPQNDQQSIKKSAQLMWISMDFRPYQSIITAHIGRQYPAIRRTPTPARVTRHFDVGLQRYPVVGHRMSQLRILVSKPNGYAQRCPAKAASFPLPVVGFMGDSSA